MTRQEQPTRISPIGDHSPAELRLAIITRLRGGWSQRQIRNTLPVRIGVIMQLSKEIGGAGYLKRRGRGRRLSPELKAQIRAAVLEGRRSSELQREFQIDYDTTIVFRREVRDFENRRHWTKMSPAQVEQATQALQRGEKWLAVAEAFHVALATLQRAVVYRKRESARKDITKSTEGAWHAKVQSKAPMAFE
jgi:transposase